MILSAFVLFALLSSLAAMPLRVVGSPTKIVPTDGAEAGHPFTIIDGGQRLIDGSMALFTLGGVTTEVGLDTHQPYNTAKGQVPSVPAGPYIIEVRRPDGETLPVGTFDVLP